MYEPVRRFTPTVGGAAAPRSGVVEVRGTVLFVERQGRGRPLLLIHGAGEDTGMLRRQADGLALAGFEVLSYDRRGTGHSGRDAWPGDGAQQHADDAAALIELFGFAGAVVLGVSSGGIVAVKLAERHPDVAACVIAWEPPAAGIVPGGAAATAALMAPVHDYLGEHPGDYVAAQALLLSALTGRAVAVDDPDFARERVNAEPMVRDDPTITLATFPETLPGARITIAGGSEPNEVVRAACEELTRRTGRPVRQVEAPHEVYLSRPDVLTALVQTVVRSRCG